MLEKDGQRFRRAQKQDRIHFWNIDTFVVDVNNENDADFAADKALRALLRSSSDEVPIMHRRKTTKIEIFRHELRMLDRNAEAQCLHFIQIGCVAVKTAQNVICALSAIARFNVYTLSQFSFIVPTARPMQFVQINCVRYTEILERTKQFAVNGFRQTDIRGNASAEVIRMLLPSIRSGVAVRPRRTFG